MDELPYLEGGSCACHAAGNHPLANRKAVSKEDLEKERLILLSGSDKTERLAAWTIEGVAKPALCLCEFTGKCGNTGCSGIWNVHGSEKRMQAASQSCICTDERASHGAHLSAME